MDNNSADRLRLGDSTSGVLGPLALAAGSPDDNYNVYIYVRVFDSLQSFSVYTVAPVQVLLLLSPACALEADAEVNRKAKMYAPIPKKPLDQFQCHDPVDFLTTDKSILDLIFSKVPDLVCNVQRLESFGSSDHKLLFCNLDIEVSRVKESRTRFGYNRMDIDRLREQFGLMEWTSVLTGTVDDCWVAFKRILLELRDKYVPVTTVKDKGKVPWINYKALKWVTKKHRIFRKYKDSSHPACRRISRITSRETKRKLHIYLKRSCQKILRRILSHFMLM